MSGRGLPHYGAVIPTYNTWDLTDACLNRLVHASHPPSQVVVVDNGSDGTAARVRATHPAVQVVDNETNAGFARAINRGSELIDAPYILWLNSDVMVEHDDLGRLVREVERRERLAAIGPRQISSTGYPLPAVHPFPSAFRPLRRRSTNATDRGDVATDHYLSGACLLVRRSAWLEIGPLDEDFFFYYEEADWQFRARKRGWDIALSDTTVEHVGGGSADGRSVSLLLLSFEGYERFILKHEGRAGLLLHRAVNLPGVVVTAFLRRTEGAGGGGDADGRRTEVARARLRQIVRPVPPSGTSPWAARLRGDR